MSPSRRPGTEPSGEAFDWAGTPLGARKEWPQSLKTAADLVLGLGPPAALFWGEECVAIHNEAFRSLLPGGPDIFGRPAKGARGGIWDRIGPLAGRAWSGEAASAENVPLEIERDGHRDLARFDMTCAPVRDERERVGGILATVLDTAALRRSRGPVADEERFRSLVEGMPQPVWRAGKDGDWTWSSPQWTQVTGLTEAESLGRGWLGALHPDDREAAQEHWDEALRTGAFRMEFRIWSHCQERFRWFRTWATPVRGRDGGVVEWLGVSTDVDDLRRLRDEQKLLLAELQHRVRNILAIVRSIARRTADSSETVEDLAMHLDGRLAAFSKVQAALIRQPGRGLNLQDLITEQMQAFLAARSEQLSMKGPEIRLASKAGETIALAIHELGTNAVKYGALSSDGGRIEIAWCVEAGDPPRLHLEWRESGGPAVEAPRRSGFGMELLQRTLAYELKAEARPDFGPGGMRWTVEFPLMTPFLAEADLGGSAELIGMRTAW